MTKEDLRTPSAKHESLSGPQLRAGLCKGQLQKINSAGPLDDFDKTLIGKWNALKTKKPGNKSTTREKRGKALGTGGPKTAEFQRKSMTKNVSKTMGVRGVSCGKMEGGGGGFKNRKQKQEVGIRLSWRVKPATSSLGGANYLPKKWKGGWNGETNHAEARTWGNSSLTYSREVSDPM